MKIKYLILTILFSQVCVANTTTPRNTFKTFLKAMVKVKENTGNSQSHYKQAISTLNIGSMDSSLRFDIGKKRAEQLINTIDKIKRVDYQTVPEKMESPIWYFDQRNFKDQYLEISVIKIDGEWLFSKKTLTSLDSYHEALSTNQVVDGVKILKRFSDKIRNFLPKSLLSRSILFENWQWLGLFCILIIGFIVEKISKVIITQILKHSSKLVKASSTEMLSHAIRPLAKIVFVFTSLKLISFLDFNTQTISIINRVLYIAMSIMTVWFAHKVIQYISYSFSKKAEDTESKFDDILVPLLTKSAFVIIYLLGALLVANSLTIDVSSVIAGLGIGGLAFAFAAKDTLANFFGSIMLVLDRPFDIGDVITAGDIEGVVTEVGFRSTRIRTFNDSLITISNGQLMNTPIDNKGKRRFRRLVTTLGLEYSTSPEKIEAFCEGIRQLIINYKWTRKDNFHVYFTDYGPSSLDIKMVVYWKTGEYSRELSERHRLMIDILRFAKELGVEFAFPTQTVHMFNENKVETVDEPKNDVPSDSFKTGRTIAKNVIDKPLSLKNPRSNSEDKNQFGDNEFGI